MINITFETDNDAFQDGNYTFEVKRILNQAIRTIESSDPDTDLDTLIRDVNGNTIGNLFISGGE